MGGHAVGHCEYVWLSFDPGGVERHWPKTLDLSSRPGGFACLGQEDDDKRRQKTINDDVIRGDAALENSPPSCCELDFRRPGGEAVPGPFHPPACGSRAAMAKGRIFRDVIGMS